MVLNKSGGNTTFPRNTRDMSATITTKEMTILTPYDMDEANNIVEIENEAWYNDEMGDHMMDKGEKKRKEYAVKESMYGHNGDQSFTTMHEKNDN